MSAISVGVTVGISALANASAVRPANRSDTFVISKSPKEKGTIGLPDNPRNGLRWLRHLSGGLTAYARLSFGLLHKDFPFQSIID